MTIEEIKKSALQFKSKNKQELSAKLKELKDNGLPFLGCIAFLQHHRNISLSEARKQIFDFEIWSEEEKKEIIYYQNLMRSELQENEE